MTALEVLRRNARIELPVRAEQRNGMSWLIVDNYGYVIAERMSTQQAYYVAEVINSHGKVKP